MEEGCEEDRLGKRRERGGEPIGIEQSLQGLNRPLKQKFLTFLKSVLHTRAQLYDCRAGRLYGNTGRTIFKHTCDAVISI